MSFWSEPPIRLPSSLTQYSHLQPETRLLRSFALFYHEPIIQLRTYTAFAYGLIYLTLTTTSTIPMRVYGQNVGIVGLNYIALGIGLTGASQCNARMMGNV